MELLELTDDTIEKVFLDNSIYLKQGIKIDECKFVRCNFVTSLRAAKLGNRLFFEGCSTKHNHGIVSACVGGYTMYVYKNTEHRISVGCRNLSVKQARKHWVGWHMRGEDHATRMIRMMEFLIEEYEAL
jgi:hypothetical protein